MSIMLFHKVPRVADPLVPNELCLKQFEHILDWVQSSANVVPLSEATKALSTGSLRERSVALTFDDGYLDWMETVAPTLLKRNLPATFFLCTEQFEGPALWHERIVAAVRALPKHGAILPYGFSSLKNLESPSSRIRLVSELQAKLKYMPLHDRINAIEALEKQACGELNSVPKFTANSARTIHSMGFEVGAHTHRHPILNECSEKEAREEIGSCREILEACIGGKVFSFAYPNGIPGRDFNVSHVSMVRQAGYRCAVVTSQGAASQTSDPLQLPRFTPWATRQWHMLFQTARNILTPEQRLDAPLEKQVSTELRALLVASTFPPIHGGSAVVYENLCKCLPEGSVRVLTARRNYLTHGEVRGWREYDSSAGFAIDRLEYLRPPMLPPPANNFISLYRLLRHDLPLYAKVLWFASSLVRRHRINLICVGELVSGSWLGIALRKWFNCKLVIYIHGEEITTASPGRLHGSRRKSYLSAADGVVAVSSFTCDALTNVMQLPPTLISLVENGVDTQRFFPRPPSASLMARHHLEGKKIILTVGRLVPRKGMDMAIQAMVEVVQRRTDVVYVIVGDGEYGDVLRNLIAEKGLQKNIVLIGKVDDAELIAWFQTCDIFLMPNRTMPDGDTEGFGLVFREANACAKPVIGGRAGGAVEAVINEQTGLLVDGNKPAEIADALSRLLEDPEFARKLGEQGLVVAKQNNTHHMAMQFLQVCERVLRG